MFEWIYKSYAEIYDTALGGGFQQPARWSPARPTTTRVCRPTDCGYGKKRSRRVFGWAKNRRP